MSEAERTECVELDEQREFKLQLMAKVTGVSNAAIAGQAIDKCFDAFEKKFPTLKNEFTTWLHDRIRKTEGKHKRVE